MRRTLLSVAALTAAGSALGAQSSLTATVTGDVMNAPAITVPSGSAGIADPRYSTTFGTANNGVFDFGTRGMSNFDGVVRIIIATPEGNFSCTGAVLQGGRNVLTAAHCVTNASGQRIATSVSIQGIGPSNTLATFATEPGTNIAIRPGYTGAVVSEQDLAVITLTNEAPTWATRYSLYTGDAQAVMGQELVLSGFGRTGLTSVGDNLNNAGNVRRAGLNVFDVSRTSTQVSTNATFGGILFGDVDDGSAANDRICNIFGGVSAVPPQFQGQICNRGVSNPLMEVGIGRGDSGGAAFFNGMIVGVASFGESIRSAECGPPIPPDTRNQACLGRIGAGFGYASTLTASNLAWVQSQIVPEPSTYALLAFGLGVLGPVSRRRRAPIA